jgi:hypothetical protein
MIHNRTGMILGPPGQEFCDPVIIGEFDSRAR